MADDKIKQYKADAKQYSLVNQPGKYIEANFHLATHHGEKTREVDGLHPSADISLEHMDIVLELVTESHDAFAFSQLHKNKAAMYLKRMGGDRPDNLVKAIECLNVAMRVLQSLGKTMDVARHHSLMIEVYQDAGYVGDGPAANRDLAIRHEIATSQIYSKTETPKLWADSHVRIGAAYTTRISGSKRGNFKVAVKYLNKALEVLTQAEHRDSWARIQSLLVSIYRDWPTGTDKSTAQLAFEQNLLAEKCIVHCNNALEVYSETYEPETCDSMKATRIDAYARRTVDEKEKVDGHKDELVDELTDGMDKLKSSTEESRGEF